MKLWGVIKKGKIVIEDGLPNIYASKQVTTDAILYAGEEVAELEVTIKAKERSKK